MGLSLPLASPPCRRWSASRYKLRFDVILGATFPTSNAYDVLRGLEPWSTKHGNPDRYGSNGDTRHYFNADDTEALSKAEERFKSLTSVGFTAAVRDAAGKATVTRSFDPDGRRNVVLSSTCWRLKCRRHVHAGANFRDPLSLAFVG
jgi:hypothetical protein